MPKNELKKMPDRLVRRVEKVQKGIATFYEVGMELIAIKEEGDYKFAYGTFEKFCKETFGFQRAEAYRLIDAAKVGENVSHGRQILPILPANKRQARELAKVPEDKQTEVLARARKTSPNGRITAKHIRATIEATKTEGVPDFDKLKTPAQVTDRLGNAILDHLTVYAFEAPKLRAAKAAVDAAVRALEAARAEPGSEHLIYSDAFSGLDMARVTINTAMPYCLIPPGVTDKKLCKVGWMTLQQYKLLPSEMKWEKIA